MRPYRIPVDGSGPVALVGAGRHAEGPILLSPHGRSCFFVEGDTLWRVGTDGSGPVALATLPGESLRLEVAR